MKTIQTTTENLDVRNQEQDNQMHDFIVEYQIHEDMKRQEQIDKMQQKTQKNCFSELQK